MPFEVADISITAWSLMSPTYETLKPHEALIKRFLGSDLQVRFPTTQAAAQALAQPAQAFPLKWRVGATPLAEANQSINQCLDALALYLRDQDKRKYQDMLDEANATGGSLFTDARKNTPRNSSVRSALITTRARTCRVISSLSARRCAMTPAHD